jgi:hypothetical protein
MAPIKSSSWTIEEDLKLLLTIIKLSKATASIKEIIEEMDTDRTSRAISGRIHILRNKAKGIKKGKSRDNFGAGIETPPPMPRKMKRKQTEVEDDWDLAEDTNVKRIKAAGDFSDN